MKLARGLSIVWAFWTITSASVFAQDAPLLSKAEATDYVETSRYDDVQKFIAALQKRSPLLRVESFGKSQEGRDLPLMILADPPISGPRDARMSGKPVVFIMANIHAGEVEGKESAQHLARRVLAGDLKHLLSRMVLLIAPIYNADGNEKISEKNRPEQYGPIAGVGRRENAQGLDLNRDYIKLESPEAKALVGVFNRWDPHLTVDLHTTNGSYHGYHLTYSIPMNPSGDPRIMAFERDVMMPVVARGLLETHRFRSYYYGNFSGRAPEPGKPETRTWQAFTHQPRIGQNYVGLRNRLAILSEAYSYLDYRDRVAVTSAFVDKILSFVAEHGPEIMDLTREADVATIRASLKGEPRPLGVSYQMKPLPEPVELLVGRIRHEKNPRSGLEMTIMLKDDFTRVKMVDFGTFAATRSIVPPRAYLFANDPGMKPVVANLLAHGIAVEALTEPIGPEVEGFQVAEIKRSGRAFQGHREIKLVGKDVKQAVAFPAGSIVVRTDQPLGTLAAYLLDPESEDGLITWNFLDAALAPDKPVPIYRLRTPANLPARLIE